jgi:hypothetical protein
MEDFSVEMFESVINFFERTNGFQRDTMTQSIALRAIGSRFDLSTVGQQKLMTEIYKYWVAKRDKWGKPLVRKYWPVVPSTDTNPHLVFRIRDRERYRLRRHRRNDIDSFRKLQQFRREFEQAKNIAQLMLERESIAEFDFMVTRDIFLEEMKELGCELTEAPHFDTAVGSTNLNYEPLYKHLWVPMNTVLPDVPVTEFDFVDDASDCTSVKDSKVCSEPAGLNGNNKANKNKLLKNGDDGRLSALTVEGLDALGEKKTTEKKRKKSEKLVVYGNDGIEILDIAGGGGRASLAPKNVKRALELGTNDFNYLGYSKPSILDEEIPLTVTVSDESGIDSKLIHNDLDGPKFICRPSWPNYYEKNSQGRGRLFISNPEDYMESLELRRDEYGEPMIPHKYRIRYRVGRGGRLVADKIPIYRSPVGQSPSDDEEGDVNEDSIRYLYPTQSRPIPLIGVRDSNSRSFPPQISGAIPSVNSLAVNRQVPSTAIPPQPNTSEVDPSRPPGPTTKPLPELPNSNRRLMNHVRKNGKLHTPGYAWCGSTIPSFSYLPPTVPPGPIAGYHEKVERLEQITSGNDSEDEDILMDHSYHSELGEFNRLLQKQAEALVNAAHVVQALPTSQKKNQQQQQLARIKLSLEI